MAKAHIFVFSIFFLMQSSLYTGTGFSCLSNSNNVQPTRSQTPSVLQPKADTPPQSPKNIRAQIIRIAIIQQKPSHSIPLLQNNAQVWITPGADEVGYTLKFKAAQNKYDLQPHYPTQQSKDGIELRNNQNTTITILEIMQETNQRKKRKKRVHQASQLVSATP